MLKAYKYRIYPNIIQREMIDKTIGVCRFVYNLALETKSYAYKSHGVLLSAYDLQRQLTKLQEDVVWIKEVDGQAVRASIKKIDRSFMNFFRGAGYPKFKSKREYGSFQCPNNARRVDWDKCTLTIPKIKDIPIRLSRKFEGKIKSVTISRTSSGKYYASILVERLIEKVEPKPITTETTIGLDVGIKSFVVSSNGKTFEPNRKLKASLKRLKCLQQRVNSKKKGSNNRDKAKKRVAILHEKITNQRTDYIHKVTTGLIRDNQAETFVIEDLNVAGLINNRRLSQALSDASLGEFFRQLKYKCEWYGKNLIVIGQFEPTSKMCSCCGEINQLLKLADREWMCINCNTLHDRDVNAAINIKNAGLKKYSGVGSPGEPVELPSIEGAEKQE